VGPFQIAGAAVVDGSGRDPVDVTVTVEDGRIAQLGASSASTPAA
jgi:N-acyl-D-aspartate/D-glutamate deacylase